jgi:DNA-binding IclR family transcriptional regulator
MTFAQNDGAEPSRYRVGAVAKALTILDVFVAPPHRFTLTEVSRRSGLSPNQTFRLLQTLVEGRFASYEPDTHRYTLGLHLFRLTGALRNSDDLLRLGGPILLWARDTSGETANLVVKDGEDGAVSIATRESRQDLHATASRGAWQPLHAGASPKLLLALRDEALIDRYLAAHQPLPAYTPHTITDPNILRAELRTIREQGYAVSQQENRLGACAVAAPVFDRRGEVLAAFSLTAPLVRFVAADRDRHVALALTAAQRLSSQLGHAAPYE